MKRLVVFFVLLCILQGCVFTGIGRDHELTAEGYELPPDISNAVQISCASTLYSMMLSPIIPFPPIIPTYGIMGNGDAYFKFNEELVESSDIVRIEMRNKNLEKVFESQIGWLFYDYDREIFSFKCAELDGYILILKDSSGKEYSAKLHYTRGEIKFGWGYLSA